MIAVIAVITVIAVIAIAGVLFMVVIHTANNISGNAFYKRGFHDETLPLLRFRQKAAIAQRRTVTDNVALTTASTASTPNCSTSLQGPKEGGTTVTAMSGVSYSITTPPLPEDFNYDCLGVPVDASGVALDTNRTIKVVWAARPSRLKRTLAIPMTSSVQRGSTLIELLFFIVVVSIGVVGILSVMNTTVRFSAEPMARKQAIVLAESILGEVVQKDYADRTGTPPVPLLLGDMDHVGDFHNVNPVSVESIFTDAPSVYVMSIVVEMDSWSVDGALPLDDDGLPVVNVISDLLGPEPVSVPFPWPLSLPVPVKKITVTVTGRGHTISLSGYRADY
jgi:MSHA pilin protein MshD